jgi:hypothetical protein
MENLLKDLRYAFRSLVKRPGFTIVICHGLRQGCAGSTSDLRHDPYVYDWPELVAEGKQNRGLR